MAYNSTNFDPPATLPKFAIAQKVTHRWLIDDPPDPLHGQIIEYFGQIWAIAWIHHEYLGKGWWYEIYFTECDHPEIHLPCWAVVHENDDLRQQDEHIRTFSAVY